MTRLDVLEHTNKTSRTHWHNLFLLIQNTHTFILPVYTDLNVLRPEYKRHENPVFKSAAHTISALFAADIEELSELQKY